MEIDSRTWAREEFGGAELGDRRRNRRLVRMASQLLQRPTAFVAAAFREDAARQGAYDFLESPAVASTAIEASAGSACALRASELQYAFVVLDGTGVSISDPSKKKEIGDMGGTSGRGLMAVSAFVIDDQGVPLGLAGQEFWARDATPAATREDRRRAYRVRPLDERQSQHLASRPSTRC